MKNIPNILSFFRIVATIAICALFISIFIECFLGLSKDHIWLDNINFIHHTFHKLIWIFVLFILGSISDFLDGWIARKYNYVSELGKIIDPIADKILNNLTFIFSTFWMFYVMWDEWRVGVSVISFSLLSISIWIIRDSIVDSVRMYAIKNKIDISANIYGKLKTIFQMISIILVVLFLIIGTLSMLYIEDSSFSHIYSYLELTLGIVIVLVLSLADFFSIYSGVKYVCSFTKKTNKPTKKLNKTK